MSDLERAFAANRAAIAALDDHDVSPPAQALLDEHYRLVAAICDHAKSEEV